MRHGSLAIVIASLIGSLIQPMVAVAQQSAPAGQVSREDSKFRGFTVTLALGDTQIGRSSGAFTPEAVKALADLKDFLPYKSYSLLDTISIFGLDGPHQFLRGQNGQKHEFYMGATWGSPSTVKVGLRLWDVEPSDRKSASRILIDTTFNLSIGETVVVGTSRIDGNLGLVLLVTAVPR
jgi:hypothetical protein